MSNVSLLLLLFEVAPTGESLTTW